MEKNDMKMWTTSQLFRKGLEKTKFKAFFRNHDTLQFQACYVTVSTLVNEGLKL